MSKNKNSIGEVLVYFICNNCKTETKSFPFEVFEGDDGKADLDLLAADANGIPLFCMNCGSAEFSADIKVNNRVLNYPD